MKTIAIVRSNDPDARFESVREAKEYMIPDYDMVEDDYTGDDFPGFINAYEDYIEELSSADTLEELARIWNSHTDVFNDGSEFKIVEIE